MPEIKITEKISYIPACENRLSSDMGIVRAGGFTYVYDTGSSPEMLEKLYSFEGKCDIIISHFHGDHNWWLAKHSVGDEGVFEGDTLCLEYRRPEYRHLYVGSHTAKYMSEGEIVDRPLTLYVPDEETDAGKTKIDIIPIPNSHCKGALILMIDDEYAFIGDASYCAGNKEGCYNAQLLKEEIEFLEALPASKLLVSHDRKFIRPRQVVLRQLKSVYEKRIPDSPYIPV